LNVLETKIETETKRRTEEDHKILTKVSDNFMELK